MAWQDRERLPSYKDVHLDILTYGIAGGKKGKDTDYANQDGGDAEDLGAKQRKITVAGVIGGINYDTERDRLEGVLNSPEAGTLVLPHHQQMRALATGWSFTENYIKGAGVAKYNITFVEILQDTLPVSSPETLSSDLPCDEAITVIGQVLEGADSDSVLDVVNEYLDTLSETTIDNQSMAYLSAKDIVDDTKAILVADDPEILFSSIGGVNRAVIDDDPDIIGAIRTLRQTFDRIAVFVPDPILQLQAKIAECKALEVAGANMLLSLAEKILDFSFLSRDKATDALIAVRDFFDFWRETVQRLEGLAYTSSLDAKDRYTVSYELLASVTEIIAIMTQGMEERAARLPGIQTIILPHDQSVITLAFDLYGTIDNIDELINENKINTPELIPAGTQIIYRSF